MLRVNTMGNSQVTTLSLKDGDSMKEIWKDIPEFEKYQASTYGKIKSFHRHTDGYILSQSDDKDGYKKVSITNELNEYTKRVHILVAQTFIENKDNLPIVHHKNGIKYDNRVENLEWSTIRRNTILAYEEGLNNNVGSNHHNSQKYEVYIEDELVACYDNTYEIVEGLTTNRTTLVDVLKKEELMYGKLRIEKVDELTSVKNLNKKFRFDKGETDKIHPITFYGEEGNFLMSYSNISVCARLNGFSRRGILDRILDGRVYKRKYIIKRETPYDFFQYDINKKDKKVE